MFVNFVFRLAIACLLLLPGAVSGQVAGGLFACPCPGHAASAAAPGHLVPEYAPSGSSWQDPAREPGRGHRTGEPIEITWGIVPDGTPIASTGPAFFNDPAGPSDLQTAFDVAFPSNVDWRARLAAAVEAWSAESGLEFFRESSDDAAAFPDASGVVGVRPDLRIGGRYIDGPGGIGAYAYPPAGDPVRGWSGGEVVIDTADAMIWTTPRDDYGLFTNVVAHEVGHALGLDHQCGLGRWTPVMNISITLAHVGLNTDDVRGIRHIYGDPGEGEERARGAVRVDLSAATGAYQVRSIDAPGEADRFELARPAGAPETVLDLIPLGVEETSGPAPNSCNGTLVRFWTRLDLSAQLQVGGGGPLAVVDATAAGAVESLLLPATGSTPRTERLTLTGSGTDPLAVQRYALRWRPAGGAPSRGTASPPPGRPALLLVDGDDGAEGRAAVVADRPFSLTLHAPAGQFLADCAVFATVVGGAAPRPFIQGAASLDFTPTSLGGPPGASFVVATTWPQFAMEPLVEANPRRAPFLAGYSLPSLPPIWLQGLVRLDTGEWRATNALRLVVH